MVDRRWRVPGGVAAVAAVAGLLGGCSADVAGEGSLPSPVVGSAPPVPAVPGRSAPGLLPGGSAAPVVPPGRDDGPQPGAAPPVVRARPIAAAFADAWVADLPADRWLAQIVPLCEPAFGARLATTDPARVPARSVTAEPQPVAEPAGGPAVYTVATDAGVLTVTVAAVDGRWLVAGNDFVRTVS